MRLPHPLPKATLLLAVALAAASWRSPPAPRLTRPAVAAPRPAVPHRLRIQIINGANLNLLGVRDPTIYGTRRFEPFLDELRRQYPAVQLDYFQSNSEGEIVDKLQAVLFDYDGVILNPGVFAYYSQAIAGVLASASCPVIEVHLLNSATLDPARGPSLVARHCRGTVAGLGLPGYRFALESLLHPAE